MGENAEKALWALLEGVIPERAGELKNLLAKYSHNFSRCEDRPGFVMDAGPYGILRFTYRTMLQMWFLGFAAHQTLYIYSDQIRQFLAKKQRFNSKILIETAKQAEETREYKRLVEVVAELGNIPKLADFSWPEGIPMPEDGVGQNIDWIAARDLSVMAAAYVFLHEIKHILFKEEGNCPIQAIDEEIECDRFARQMMIGELKKYTDRTGEPIEKVREKRASSMILATFFMMVITPKEAWNGTQTHPRIEDRVKVIVDDLEIPDNGITWIYLICVCLAQLECAGKIPEEISFNSYKELGLAVMKEIR